VDTYVGVGIRSDKLQISVGYLLGGRTYHGHVGFGVGVDYRLPSDDTGNITESAGVVSGNRFWSGKRLT
jgi:hypothetical protein